MSEQAESLQQPVNRTLPFKKIVENPTLRKIGLGAIILGNVAKFFGSIETINKWVNDKIGFRPSEYLYNNLRYIVIFVLVVGYTVAACWVYKRFFASDSMRKKIVEGVALALVVSVIFYLNVLLLPQRPRVEVLIPEKAWVKAIFSSQAPNGGIRMQAGNSEIDPQVWTTAQSLQGVLSSQTSLSEEEVGQVKRAFNYIEGARKGPHAPEHFEEGWGLFEYKKKSVTEVAAWVTLAHVESVESKARIWNAAELRKVSDRVERDLQYILKRQEGTGGWRPIEEPDPTYTRTYSTMMAVWALIEARRSETLRPRMSDRYDQAIVRGVNWLLTTYNTDLGWVPNPNRPGQRERFEGMTAHVLYVLSRVAGEPGFEFLRREQRYASAKTDFLNKENNFTRRFVCSNDRIHDFDVSFDRVDFTLEGSTLLWFPWTVAALTSLSEDPSLSPEQRGKAVRLREGLLQSKISDLNTFVESEFMYVVAENLFCLSGSEPGRAGSSTRPGPDSMPDRRA